MRSELIKDNVHNYHFPKNDCWEDPVDATPLNNTVRLLRKALKKAGFNFIKLTSGGGKTRYMMAEIQVRKRNYVTVIAMSDHALMEGTIEKFAKPGTKVLHWYGRTSNNMCDRPDEIIAAMNNRLDPGKVVCWKCSPKKEKGQKRGRKRKGTNAPVEKKQCKFNKQVEEMRNIKSGIIVCPYQSLRFILEANEYVEKVYIDENCIGAFYHEHRFLKEADFKEVIKQITQQPQSIEFIKQILDFGKQAASALKEMKQNTARFYNQPILSNFWKRTIWEVLEITKEQAHDKMRLGLLLLSQKDDKFFAQNNVSGHAIQWLNALFEGVAWIEIQNDKDSKDVKVTYSYLEKQVPNINGVDVTVLDATGDVEVINALFEQDFTTHEIRIDYNLDITWFKHHGLGKVKAVNMEAEDIEKYLKIMTAKVRNGVKKAVLVTHMEIEQTALSIAKKLMPEIEWLSGHYYNLRGKNDFEYCDCMICLGVPIRNPSALIDVAAALFPDDMDRQQRFLQKQNEEELYQAIHRIRPVRNEDRKVIVAGSYFPEDLIGQVTEKIELGRIGTVEEEALERLAGLEVVTKEIAASLGVGEKKNEDKVKALYHGNEKLILSSNQNFWGNLIKKLAERDGLEIVNAKSMTWDKRNYALAAVKNKYSMEQLGIEVKGKQTELLDMKDKIRKQLQKQPKMGGLKLVKNS